MSVFRLSKMLMKTKGLSPSLQDVDERKGVIENDGQEETLARPGSLNTLAGRKARSAASHLLLPRESPAGGA